MGPYTIFEIQLVLNSIMEEREVMRTYSQTVEHVTLVGSSAKIGPTPKRHEFESKNFKRFFFIPHD